METKFCSRHQALKSNCKQCNPPEVNESELKDLLCLELDVDGCPTDKSLTEIMNYDGSHKELMEHIAPLFHIYGRCELRDIDNTWEVATGGWSGNESIIRALQNNNFFFWLMSWKLSRRGGYYEFETET